MLWEHVDAGSNPASQNDILIAQWTKRFPPEEEVMRPNRIGDDPCRIGPMAERGLPKPETRVRFPYAASLVQGRWILS